MNSTDKKPLIPTAPGSTLSLPEDKLYDMSSSPHVSADAGTRSIMGDVLIAMLPALIGAVFFFGWRSLVLTLISAAACVAFEWLWCTLMKKPQSIGDLSAVVTGVLIAFNLPSAVPYYVPIVASAFAIIIVKQLYGGLGRNFMNPALAGRVFVFFCFTKAIATFPAPFEYAPLFGSTADVITAATPLAAMKQAALPDFTLLELLLGQNGGTIGETSAILLLVGGLFLVVRKVIRLKIPLFYLGTVAVLTFIFPRGGISNLNWMLYNLLSGGLMLGAIFMATDYATSPVTDKGQIIYGIGCGALTVLFRYFGSYAEGVSFAILLMNICAWLFDKAGFPRRYGVIRKKGDKANG